MKKRTDVLKIFGMVVGVLFTFMSILAPRKWSPIYLTDSKDSKVTLNEWAITYGGFAWSLQAERVPSILVDLQSSEVKDPKEKNPVDSLNRNPASSTAENFSMKSMEVILKVAADHVAVVSIKTVQLGEVEAKAPTLAGEGEAPDNKDGVFLFTFLNASSQIVHQEYHPNPFSEGSSANENVDTGIVSLDFENKSFNLLFTLPAELNIDSVEVMSQTPRESHQIGRASLSSI